MTQILPNNHLEIFQNTLGNWHAIGFPCCTRNQQGLCPWPTNAYVAEVTKASRSHSTPQTVQAIEDIVTNSQMNITHTSTETNDNLEPYKLECLIFISILQSSSSIEIHAFSWPQMINNIILQCKIRIEVFNLLCSYSQLVKCHFLIHLWW